MHLVGFIPLVRTGPYLILGLVLGAFVYVRTNAFKQRTGVSPWHIHPIVWALVTVFISLIGTFGALIAMSTTRARGAGDGRPQTPPGTWGGQPYGAPPAGSAPYGAPPYGAVPAAATAVVGAGAADPAAGVAGAQHADWYPDPSGRHQLRYWDGGRWTDHVSDGGVAGEDPVPG